jgi:hypothetical protein
MTSLIHSDRLLERGVDYRVLTVAEGVTNCSPM